ncbi:hypothetical protein BGZ76_003033 [Entomortierella beljakovae]|nr:hypothetical protein BGZ76_003033 [Entomortierella beljakovae]
MIKNNIELVKLETAMLKSKPESVSASINTVSIPPSSNYLDITPDLTHPKHSASFHNSGNTSHDMVIKPATTLSRFMEPFYQHYHGLPMSDLLDDFAWRYMDTSLTKVQLNLRSSCTISPALSQAGSPPFNDETTREEDVFPLGLLPLSKESLSGGESSFHCSLMADITEPLISPQDTTEFTPSSLSNNFPAFLPISQVGCPSHVYDDALEEARRSVKNSSLLISYLEAAATQAAAQSFAYSCHSLGLIPQLSDASIPSLCEIERDDAVAYSEVSVATII